MEQTQWRCVRFGNRPTPAGRYQRRETGTAGLGHAAFDRELFTIDQDYQLCVNPSFETQNDTLQQTIIDLAGERITIPDGSLEPQYVKHQNASLEWV